MAVEKSRFDVLLALYTVFCFLSSLCGFFSDLKYTVDFAFF